MQLYSLLSIITRCRLSSLTCRDVGGAVKWRTALQTPLNRTADHFEKLRTATKIYCTANIPAYMKTGKTLVGESALNAAVKPENIVYGRKALKIDYWFFKTRNGWLADNSSTSRYRTIWSWGLSQLLIKMWVQFFLFKKVIFLFRENPM